MPAAQGAALTGTQLADRGLRRRDSCKSATTWTRMRRPGRGGDGTGDGPGDLVTIWDWEAGGSGRAPGLLAAVPGGHLKERRELLGTAWLCHLQGTCGLRGRRPDVLGLRDLAAGSSRPEQEAGPDGLGLRAGREPLVRQSRPEGGRGAWPVQGRAGLGASALETGGTPRTRGPLTLPVSGFPFLKGEKKKSFKKTNTSKGKTYCLTPRQILREGEAARFRAAEPRQPQRVPERLGPGPTCRLQL